MSKFTRTIAIDLAERKEGTKTFSATISTDTPVRRSDWDGEYLEVLSHKKGAVDLGRAPLPLLESHNARALPIGIVDNLRIVGSKLKGEVQFGTSSKAREIAADVEAGIIRNLSVGYSIEAVTREEDGDQVTVTATRWTPHEVSAVSVPADAGAGFGRSQDMGKTKPKTIHTREADDAEELAPDELYQRHLEAGDQSAAERVRSAAITEMADACGFASVASELIRNGASIDQARKRLVDLYAEHRQRTAAVEQMDGHIRIHGDDFEAVRGRGTAPRITGGGPGGGDDFRSAAVDALLLRAGIRIEAPHAAARDVSPRVVDLARTCLSRAGQRVPGSTEKLLKRAMSSSDFPLILGDAMHKAVRRGYEDEPASHRQWVRPVPVRDFKDQNRPILGSAPNLDQVLEGGEYTHGPLDEDSAKYRVAKYGKIVSLTWESLVNDDLDAFMRVKPAMGQAARRKEADTVYALLAENAGTGPTMQDGTVLFHADHGNLGTAGAFNATTLGAARSLLRKQTALGGGYLSLVPRYMIVPSELETDAEILLATATRHISTDTEAQTPRWLRNLELVVEPRLADDAIYLAADTGQIDTCELGLLDENQSGPVIDEEREFDSDIFKWKVRHVFGAKFLDWRGIVRQPIS